MKIPHQYILLFLFLFVGQMVYAQVDPIRAALFLKLKKESNKNINATQGALGVKWASSIRKVGTREDYKVSA